MTEYFEQFPLLGAVAIAIIFVLVGAQDFSFSRQLSWIQWTFGGFILFSTGWFAINKGFSFQFGGILLVWAAYVYAIYFLTARKPKHPESSDNGGA